MPDSAFSSTSERLQKNMILSEEFKESCSKLQHSGIDLLNLQRELVRMQVQIREGFEKAEEEKRQVIEDYERLILRILDVLNDFDRIPVESRETSESGPAARCIRTLLTSARRIRILNGLISSDGKLVACRGTNNVELMAYFKTILLDAVKREGVTPMVISKGQVFDPSFHVISRKVISDRFPQGTVIKEMESGYMLGSSVMKKAKVIITERRVKE